MWENFSVQRFVSLIVVVLILMVEVSEVLCQV